MIVMFKSLGEKISMLRKEAGFTQAQMAEKIGISRPSLVKIENSQRAISLEEGDAISKVLGISIDSLLVEEKKQIEEKSFAKAFKAKGMTDDNLAEIAKFELLFDALITQEQIYRG
jgi:transcriptional regulator with XRE-family HTH domain